MDIVVVVEFLEEGTDFGHLFVGQRGEVLWEVPEFGGDHGPTVGCEPA